MAQSERREPMQIRFSARDIEATPYIVRWPDEAFGPWECVVDWTVIDGRAECTGLTTRWVGDRATAQPITVRQLRRIPIGELIDRARSEHAQLLLEIETLEPRGSTRSSQQRSALDAAPRRRGRPRQITDEDLKQVARVYEAAYADGASPTIAVANELNLSHSAAGARVRRARDAGHLAEARRRS